MVCVLCGDLKVTSDLLCKNILPEQLSKNIKQYIKCKECDNKIEVALFKNIMRKLSISSQIWFPHTVEVAKKEIKDTKLKKYINKYTLYCIKSLKYDYLYHLNYRNIKDFRRQIRYNEEKDRWKQEMKEHNKTAPQDINFEDLAVKFFSDLFKQKLKKENYDFMIKMLHKIFYD